MNAISESLIVSLIEGAGSGMSWGGTAGEVVCDFRGVDAPKFEGIWRPRGVEKGVAFVGCLSSPLEYVVFSPCIYRYIGRWWGIHALWIAKFARARCRCSLCRVSGSRTGETEHFLEGM